MSLAGKFKCGVLVPVMATIPHVPTAIVENGFMPTVLLVLMGCIQFSVCKNVTLVEGKFNKGPVSKGYSKKNKKTKTQHGFHPTADISLIKVTCTCFILRPGAASAPLCAWGLCGNILSLPDVAVS